MGRRFVKIGEKEAQGSPLKRLAGPFGEAGSRLGIFD